MQKKLEAQKAASATSSTTKAKKAAPGLQIIMEASLLQPIWKHN